MDTLGPLTYNDNGAIVVVGVTSWRRSFDRNNKHLKSKQICKQHGTYSVFTQVAAQLKWIKEVIENPPETCKHRDEPFFDNAYIYFYYQSLNDLFNILFSIQVKHKEKEDKIDPD